MKPSLVQRNHTLPSNIVIFRDGVGDGRLEFTRQHEIPQMKAAFADFDDYSPKLSMIIVSKRIKTRMLALMVR
jgi:hypothetical protein